MAKKPKETSYWPHMILGFLLVGITLGYWTVKSATSVPVQESNEFMMKYQQADLHINDIHARKANFDKGYTIAITGEKRARVAVENAKRTKSEESVLLRQGVNNFSCIVSNKSDATPVSDANVTFLLTRPHTDKDNQLIKHVPFAEGAYRIKDINITKPGRYILRLRVIIDPNTIGYSELPAYLIPEKE